MNICKALLKGGYAPNFSISILEYCDSNNRLVREQYYIDLLQPEYNILKKAGSSVGYLHPFAIPPSLDAFFFIKKKY